MYTGKGGPVEMEIKRSGVLLECRPLDNLKSGEEETSRRLRKDFKRLRGFTVFKTELISKPI